MAWRGCGYLCFCWLKRKPSAFGKNYTGIARYLHLDRAGLFLSFQSRQETEKEKKKKNPDVEQVFKGDNGIEEIYFIIASFSYVFVSHSSQTSDETKKRPSRSHVSPFRPSPPRHCRCPRARPSRRAAVSVRHVKM